MALAGGRVGGLRRVGASDGALARGRGRAMSGGGSDERRLRGLRGGGGGTDLDGALGGAFRMRSRICRTSKDPVEAEVLS